MRALCTICTLAALFAAGCDGNDGAVSVRWRMVDLTLGDVYDPKSGDIVDRNGACCPSAHIVGKECETVSPWVVRDLRIVLSNPSTNEMVPSPSFLCEFGEHTTQFTMPTGLWFIGLFARVEDGAGRPVPWTVPPPEMHTIVKGDIVNLQEIEVGVNPLVTPADAGSGGADGGMPGDDGGAGTAAVPLPRTGRMVTF